ncbi:hypothetical protein GJ744_010290 [Endocarpon pusillum]|uniref:Uncharacterized protein n=1 Tax=Endocarpon pusillum TaxID=364733 RepID=A0A8H7AM54_9EURO|nr:hypothetical protein GJ744_010290 [Endocarpon pusillum]
MLLLTPVGGLNEKQCINRRTTASNVQGLHDPGNTGCCINLTLLIYPRCGHVKSSMGIIYHCPSWAAKGRTCLNEIGLTFKDYNFIIEDTRTQCFLESHEPSIPGDWKTEIALGYKGYCNNCVEGRTEPRNERQRQEFLDVYLGEYERWGREAEKRKKMAVEQERLIQNFKTQKKGETEACTTEAE